MLITTLLFTNAVCAVNIAAISIGNATGAENLANHLERRFDNAPKTVATSRLAIYPVTYLLIEAQCAEISFLHRATISGALDPACGDQANSEAKGKDKS